MEVLCEQFVRRGKIVGRKRAYLYLRISHTPTSVRSLSTTLTALLVT